MTLPRCFGVFGHPIAHSRSPAMHNAAFAQLGLPHRYLAFDVHPSRLGEALRGAAALGFGGLNLTVPHKRAALQWMDRLSPEAEALGAVNTVCLTEDGLVGRNTDGEGFLAGVRALCGEVADTAVVLGGGGAARAVVYALTQRDTHVVWASRTPGALPRWAGAEACDYGSLASGLARAGLLVNATSVGMAGGPARFPVPIDVAALPEQAAVVDLVYPRPDGGLLDAAAARGLRVQDGLPMLWGQGALALEHWLGHKLSAEAREAMRAALDAC